jgi:hypothetical protein
MSTPAEPALSEVGAVLIREARQYAVDYVPTSLALLSGEPTSKFENLSPKGLSAQREVVSHRLRQLNAMATDNLDRLDVVIILELRRYFYEQHVWFNLGRRFETSFGAYLDLIKKRLMIALMEKGSVGPSNVHLAACNEWITEAQNRLNNKGLSFSERDKSAAAELIEAIASEGGEFAAACSVIADRLSDWCGAPTHTSSKPSLGTGDPRHHVRELFGVRTSFAELRDVLWKTLKGEVAALREYRNLAPTAGWSSPLRLSEQNHIDAIRTISLDLSRFFSSFSRGHLPKFVRASPIARTLIKDAAYIPFCRPFSNDELGYVVVSGLYSVPNRQADWVELCCHRALIAAHECTPGHKAHLEASQQSALASLFLFTRSPIGFEGWAAMSERLLLATELACPRLNARIHVETIKRLMAALQVLSSFDSPKEWESLASGILCEFQDADRRAIEVYKDLKWHLFPYGIGIAEIEAALERIGGLCALHQRPHALLRTFARWGPLNPRAVADLESGGFVSPVALF